MQKNTIDNGFVTIMNDFQFMPKQNNWPGSILGFVLFSYVDLYYASGNQHIYKTTDTTSPPIIPVLIR
jgi:maltose/moltooligosaccharide transporter